MVTDIFASDVFNADVMKEMLSKESYEQFQQCVNNGHHLDIELANEIASNMKKWAIEKGATHYTHWFQPLTGITAEKHDSFISPKKDGCGIIMEFSGKELIKGESDASSLPNGGLRATFEARGYTAWDPTSYAFIKEGVLCIPTAFCSYGGEALDEKTPLLRSMEAINKQGTRILKLFNVENPSLTTTVGPEQEYFLVPKELYEKRKDLMYTGRTLFGSHPPKGQEMNDHYFGTIKTRVHEFMKELDERLWRLGILAKTEHNEAAPAQYELAPVFTTTNIAVDHNQLTMEIMQRTAKKHGLVCLLHEKPFAYVNGSGKHNNWSISTIDGVNLLDPGKTPQENAQFLLFLCAVIKAADDYQDLFRISVASAGNDHRLGASEAPPAVISMFLGDDLTDLLLAIEAGEKIEEKKLEQFKVGVHVLSRFTKDTTDRNRTSPIAFTGNKFEFRMPGSQASVAEPDIVLNTAVAESLCQFADILENSKDFEGDIDSIVRKTIKEHKRIFFNGNGYDEKWIEEAQKRGLSNYPSTPVALSHFLDKKNVELFEKHHVLSLSEMRSRYEIMLENYSKTINIEARTMIDMVNKDILPAYSRFSCDLAEAVLKKHKVSEKIDCTYEIEILNLCAKKANTANDIVKKLKEAVKNACTTVGTQEQADSYKNNVIPLMEELRKEVDSLEEKVGADYWPYPSYAELLFGIN